MKLFENETHLKELIDLGHWESILTLFQEWELQIKDKLAICTDAEKQTLLIDALEQTQSLLNKTIDEKSMIENKILAVKKQQKALHSYLDEV